MFFFVYAIKNDSSGKIYIGQTEDIDKRIARHNDKISNKKSSYTFKNTRGGKWRLIYSEKFSTRKEAMERERQLKSSRGRNFIKSIIEKDS